MKKRKDVFVLINCGFWIEGYVCVCVPALKDAYTHAQRPTRRTNANRTELEC